MGHVHTMGQSGRAEVKYDLAFSPRTSHWDILQTNRQTINNEAEEGTTVKGKETKEVCVHVSSHPYECGLDRRTTLGTRLKTRSAHGR